MKFKSWKEHEDDMNKKDRSEMTSIAAFCLVGFSLICALLYWSNPR
ncbi:hypothetical protein [Thalassotalea marina]|nr:hypothetical protein [Thalassotalea marina]